MKKRKKLFIGLLVMFGALGIEGSYRVDGKINGTKSLKEYISIHPTKGLLIGNKWYSNNGFQQHMIDFGYSLSLNRTKLA